MCAGCSRHWQRKRESFQPRAASKRKKEAHHPIKDCQPKHTGHNFMVVTTITHTHTHTHMCMCVHSWHTVYSFDVNSVTWDVTLVWDPAFHSQVSIPCELHVDGCGESEFCKHGVAITFISHASFSHDNQPKNSIYIAPQGLSLEHYWKFQGCSQ